MHQRLPTAAALARAARNMNTPHDLHATLRVVVVAARDTIPGIDHVALTITDRDGATEATVWTDDVAATGLRLLSQLGVELRSDGHAIGALSLSSTSRTLPEETEQVADLFATHAGIAVGHARRADNLRRGLESRMVIGMAVGMLMERLAIEEAAAFAYLTRISGSTETKVRDVAQQVVTDHGSRLASR